MKAPSKSKTIVNLRTFLFIVNLYTVAFILLKVQIKNNLTSDINKKMRLGKISSASGLQGSKKLWKPYLGLYLQLGYVVSFWVYHKTYVTYVTYVSQDKVRYFHLVFDSKSVHTSLHILCRCLAVVLGRLICFSYMFSSN